MKNLLYIFSTLILLSSCFKEEDKRLQNTVASESMKLGDDYGNVYFYNLSTQTVVSQSLWSDWDLAFYAQETDSYIKLNDGANMKAFKTSGLSFESVTSLNPNWKSIVDDATGVRENIALDFEKDYINNDTTYYKDKTFILLTGINALGEDLGYKKVSLLYTYLNHYHFRHSNLDGSEDYISKISKDVTLNYVHFSFKNKGETVQIEPDKTTWDIVFKRSTDIAITNDFSDTIFDYSVSSVLLNPFSSEGYVEEEIVYEDINYSSIKNDAFTNQLNIIGFDWKAYDLNNSIYAIRQNKYYIVKDINNFYYKIKFISFYDPETNIKGTISFQYEIIK